MAKDVKCEVNSCVFWGDGDKCDASSIYVVNTIDAQASNSSDTDCKTFESKM